MTTDNQIFEKITSHLERNERVALCTLVEKTGSGPRTPGAKMIIAESGETAGTIGGGSFERALAHQARLALNEGKSKKIVFSLDKTNKKGRVNTGMICGGELTIFIDIIKPTPRLIIIGAGHIAYPLAQLASILSYSIVVVDEKANLANRKRFPMADQTIAGNVETILSKLNVTTSDMIVIVHGEAEFEYKILREIINFKPSYIGLLGSKNKSMKLLNRLRDAGIDDEYLDRIRAPIGLKIQAETPEEIAVSILAEIIKNLRQ